MTDQEWSDANLQQERDRQLSRAQEREVAEQHRKDMDRARENSEHLTRLNDPVARGNIP